MKTLLLLTAIGFIGMINSAKAGVELTADVCNNAPEGSMIERKCIQNTDWELSDCVNDIIHDAQTDDKLYEIDESEAIEFCQNAEKANYPATTRDIRGFNPQTGKPYYPSVDDMKEWSK